MATTTDTSSVPAQRASRFTAAKLREAGWGYAFVALPMAVFGLFFLYPFAYGIYISFYNWGILGKVNGVGWGNYSALWHDNTFHIALKNIFEYTVVVVPLEMTLGLSTALIVNAKIRGQKFFRAAFYFPALASSAAITTIAIYILNADGLLNRVLGTHRSWFGDPATAIWSIVGLNAWTTSGTIMLMYLAALQAIRVLLAGKSTLGDPQWGQLHLLDGLAPSLRTMRIPKDGTCRGCSGA